MESLNQSTFEKAIFKNALANVVFVSSKQQIEQCDQMVDLLNDLAQQEDYKKAKYFMVDFEENESLVKQFSIVSVPTIVLFRTGNEIDRVVGVDTKQLTDKVRKAVDSNSSLEKRLIALINQSPVMIFIKGTPAQPRCGFTRTLLALLAELDVKFGYFDILSDEEVRQNLKIYSNWPTYPQLYVKGELIGGLDIIQDLHKNGELTDMLKV